MKMNKGKRILNTFVLSGLLVIGLAACSFGATEAPPVPGAPPADTPTPEAPTEEPAPPEATPALPAEPLGGERQLLSFTTSDGRSLEGYYYPAKALDAPMVVLMHWARGTMEDWHEIALWLQNRTVEEPSTFESRDAAVSYSAQASEPWRDASWFPALPGEVSFGVLVFNFGGYGNSQGGTGQDALFQDAMAALSAAASLPGVDRKRIIAAGASIGADASVNSCAAFNAMEVPMGTCLGAFSISPGNYLGKDYGESVRQLRNENPPKMTVCLAAANDGNALVTCLSGAGPNFTSTAYEGGDHGMDLVRSELNPNVLILLVEFLEMVFGIDLQPPPQQ